MPRYYFNSDNHQHDEDREGTDLANADEARAQAVIFAGDYLRDHPELVWDGSRFKVTVVDEARTVLLTVVVSAEKPTVNAT
jgi:predicted phosphodiesterase